MKVAIIGASNKPDRYSYKALMLLKEKGHEVFPVHVRLVEIEGIAAYKTLDDIKEEIDTVTLYVSADISFRMTGSIINKNPKRVIFNPGAENPELKKSLEDKGIETLNACTLVMLRTGQF